MVEFLLLSLVGLGLTSVLADFSDEPESDQEPGSDQDTTSEPEANETKEFSGLPEENWISENTAITLSQVEIEDLLAYVQETGEVPDYILDNNATVKIEIEGEINGYLHTLNYSDYQIYEGYQTVEQHSLLVFSDSPEAPELLDAYSTNDYGSVFRDSGPEARTIENGTILLDIQTSHIQETYNDVGFQVIEAGRIEFNSFNLETVAPECYEFQCDSGYISVGDSFQVYGENDYHTELSTNDQPLEVLSDGTNLDLSAEHVEQLITEVRNDEEGEVKAFKVDTDAEIVVNIDTQINETIHKISVFDASTSTETVMLVRSGNPEPPIFTVTAYGEVYFEDLSIEPFVAFDVSSPDSTIQITVT